MLIVKVQSSNSSLSYCVENKGCDKMKFLGQLLHSLCCLVKLAKFAISPLTLLRRAQTQIFWVCFITVSGSIEVWHYCEALLVWSVWEYSSPFIYMSIF